MGKDLVLGGLAWYEYRDTDIGSYREVAVAVSVQPRNRRPSLLPRLNLWAPSSRRKVGFHILHLPVTTRVACAAGVELWGFPKFVTDISLEIKQDVIVGEVQDPETAETIVRLSGDVFGGLPLPGSDLVLYSQRGSVPLRTVVKTRVWFSSLGGSSFHLLPGYSRHPMAETIRSLGLHERHPWLVQFSRSFQSRLPLGIPL